MPPRSQSLTEFCAKHDKDDDNNTNGQLKRRRQGMSSFMSTSCSTSSSSLASRSLGDEEKAVSCFPRTQQTRWKTSTTNNNCSQSSTTTSPWHILSSWLAYTQQLFPVTTTLPVLVLMDMIAVSLVVPLLFQYYKAAGVTGSGQRELLTCVYSSAQIVGGLLFGILTDAGKVHRRTMLLYSFAGSGVSYALLMIGGLPAIVLSRVLVGLVKQTMTVSITVITAATTTSDRAKHVGRLTAASTVAWIVGPSAGALLYEYVGPKAPCLAACSLFAVNLILAVVFLKDEQEDETNDSNHDIRHTKKSKPRLSIWSNLKSCFSSKTLGSVVVVNLIVTWVTKATNYSQLGSFYEDMYGLEPHHRGYISSYQQALQFIVQSALVDRVLRFTGGERRTICFFTTLLVAAVVLEAQRSLWLFLFVICPVTSLSFAITNLSLQTLVTHVAPANAIFSVLAALDVLQNVVSVSVPFYRTVLFRLLRSDNAEISASMEGDPDPVAWIRSSAVHWGIAALSISYLLLSNKKTDSGVKRN